MNLNLSPTGTRRAVVLEIQTTRYDQRQPDRSRSAGTETITCIHMLVDDGKVVKEAHFSGAAEISLLREFWGAVQPDDLFYGYQVVDHLAFLRKRTWALDLIPSRELDLRTMYGHDAIDTAILRSSIGGAGYRSAQALVSVLGLTGISKPGEHPLRDAR